MNELQIAEKELYELTKRVAGLRKESEAIAVENYIFQDLAGEVSLLELFGDNDTLFLIHNMGQGCRYCTLWGDGLNGFIAHMESKYSLALVSKDSPKVQRQFANSRNWRFNLASHAGGKYIQEQSVLPGEGNMPGVVCYIRKGNEIFRKNSSIFGPGDEYCPQWNLLSLAGVSTEDWTPQFNYWQRPTKLDDGGENLN